MLFQLGVPPIHTAYRPPPTHTIPTHPTPIQTREGIPPAPIQTWEGGTPHTPYPHSDLGRGYLRPSPESWTDTHLWKHNLPSSFGWQYLTHGHSILWELERHFSSLHIIRIKGDKELQWHHQPRLLNIFLILTYVARKIWAKATADEQNWLKIYWNNLM